ncbi:Phosphoinositide 3-phosphatase [Pseudozyma hubeiensis]|nr:Phosphoinositide 3-phosphatase [Pseudozyma hubeiensis]
MQTATASASATAATAAFLTPLPTPKVDTVADVWFQRKGESNCRRGVLRITAHHLVFEHQTASTTEALPRSISIPLSLILKATRIPSLRIVSQPGAPSQRIYPLTLFYKTFDSAAFAFQSEQDQLNVFDSLKDCAVLTDISQLYAFYHQLPPKFAPSQHNLARIYDPKAEFARQGIGSRSKAWRFTDINSQYAFCATYPALMAVPSRISDTTLSYAAKYRSKARVPALTYLHWANHASITRSSQPMVGLKNARSIQDEKLIEAIFTSHHFADPESITAKAAADASSGTAASSSGAPAVATVYGATTTNLIVDARPTTNAMANVAKGAGTENMEYYKGCKKSYLGIENIHVMRDSLSKLTEALRESEPIANFGMRVEAFGDASASAAVTDGTGSVLRLHPTPVDATALRKSMWLKHIQSLMEGSMSIVRNVHINSSHVLIHCSDGWDRTSQLAAIAQVCLDPYFRTFDGLAVLIEKDWLSFGHKFTDRSGLKGSDRYFTVASRNQYQRSNEDEDDGSDTDPDTDKANSGAGGGFDSQAAANAFWGFTKQLTANFSAATSSAPAGPKKGSNIKETSPVFHQFLDCMWQIMRQFPDRFEYNSAYLVELHQTLHECKYGTFLMDCERERFKPHDHDGRPLPPVSARTVSAWTYLLHPDMKTKHRNPKYNPGLDDRDPKRKATDMGVLIAEPRDVRYFEQLFQRAYGDMNAYLEKEADERRRARERLERAVRGGDAPNASTDALKVADVNGTTVEGSGAGPVRVPGGGELEKADATIAVVGPNDPDPVLDPLAAAVAGDSVNTPSKSLATSPAPGAVDLASNGQIDPTRLSYQARQPRNRAQQTAESSTTSNMGDSTTAMANNASSAADAAANRMKNLFIGGWGRLQEAIAAPASESSPLSQDSATLARPPASPTKASNGSASSSQQGPLDLHNEHNRQSPAHGIAAPTAHNPWAANASMRAEMQREHVAMRTTLSSAGGRSPYAGRPGYGANDRQQSWSGSIPSSGSAHQATEPTEGKEDKQGSSNTMSDPLGVL